ncbi:uncharacterized protein EV422DRAFT_510180 [Fimicolochytrium jonesii]|uniref:uncharacterized protein n=1 Tax=Fimicolochytrium jonesii TaxID=1396493 RepID=UPI0022FE8AE1|nr:uncharacterized protein EV422DRAFT_510180 [Fimicolochytrium jonesii]KAI8815938.1 hypothetical protein EV422DRAFT_510180 [Fimicolochytrium jonesii]
MRCGRRGDEGWAWQLEVGPMDPVEGFELSLPKEIAPTIERADVGKIVEGTACAKFNILFAQEDLQSLDLMRLHGSTQRLRKAIEDSTTKIQVPFVPAMSSDAEDVVGWLRRSCAKREVVVSRLSVDSALRTLFRDTANPQLLIVRLPSAGHAAPSDGSPRDISTRAAVMDKNDEFISSVLDEVKKVAGDDWTAVLTGLQLSEAALSLQRRSATQPAHPLLSARAATNWTAIPYSKRPIFQKYVFFSPGLFMCITAMIPIVVVALLGVRILMSIQTPSRFEGGKKDK